ncbi:MAG: HEAT repeat domain-containing protein [Planctomycetota bacterium]
MVFLLFCGAAIADDLLTPGEEVLRELAEQAEDERAMVALLREASDIYRYPAAPSEATALFGAVGKATRSKSAVVRVAALRALASMGDPKAAAFVEPFLREMKPKPEERPALLTAIEAAGRLHVTTLVPPLLALAKSGQDPTVADQALLALGRFSVLPVRERKSLVDKVLALSKSLKRNRRRWRRLAAPALRSLQLLTGKKLNSVELFADWWKVARESKDPFAANS